MRFSYTKEKEYYAQELGRYVWGDPLCAQQRLDSGTLLERSPRIANEGSKPFHMLNVRGSGLLRTSVSYTHIIRRLLPRSSPWETTSTIVPQLRSRGLILLPDTIAFEYCIPLAFRG